MTDKGINAEDFVTVTRMGHIEEVQYLEKKTPEGFCAIKVIENNQYLKPLKDSDGNIIVIPNWVDGVKKHEVIFDETKKYDFNKSENKSQNLVSLKRTMKRLRYKINNNFRGDNDELFITLTYAENMTDTKKLYKDCDAFIRKIKRMYSNYEVRYINVVEPQERGAWHCHILLKIVGFKDDLFIPNPVIEKKWGHGFTKVKKISSRNVDNLGAYLTSYLTDIEVGDNVPGGVEKTVIEGRKKVTKKFKKGGRLHLYPSEMNFYRCSRNCNLPIRIVMKYKDFLKSNFGKKVFESAFLIIDDNVEDWEKEERYGGKYLNRLNFEVYNTLAKNC